MMSSNRLCVRCSKVSCDFLSEWGERRTVKRSTRVGRGMGPATRAPVRLTVSAIVAGGLIYDPVVKCLQANAYALSSHKKNNCIVRWLSACRGSRFALSKMVASTLLGTCSNVNGSIEYEARPLESERIAVA